MEKTLQSMQPLKDTLVSPPVFTLSHLTGHLSLDTDAGNVQVGRVLQQ